ncbi:MAG TPA: hypothetical protein VFN36_06715 [Solirubrobacteraceae bacterium]|nr:hypothetical protein [Solirubrobacteraceae bacterium]
MRRAPVFLTSIAATLGLLLAFTAAALAAPLHWSAGRQIDRSGGVGLGSLVCPASTQCDALDANDRLVQFDPASPARATRVQITAPAPLTALACASATQCTLLDQAGGEATFDPSAPPVALTFTTVDPAVVSAMSAAQPRALTCPSSTVCVLGDGLGNVVVFDPAAPSQTTSSSPAQGEDFGIVAVACASAAQCTAISQTREWTFDSADPAAVTTATIDTRAGFARALTCVSASQCTAVDQSGHETTFDPQTGVTSGPVSLATSPYTQFNSVACPSAFLCVAPDLAGHLTSFDPRTGQAVANPAAPSVQDVACPTASACVADDGAGQALEFAPGGAAAPTATRIDAGAALVSLACPGRAQCTAVDALHELTFDPLSSRVPQHLRRLSGRASSSVGAVACATLTLCSATRADSEISFNPRAFGRARLRLADHNGDAGIVTVRCPSPVECVTIDGDGIGVTYDPRTGRILRRAINVEEVEALTALACPTRAQCTATDNNGTMITFDPLSGRRLLTAKIDRPVGLDAPSGASVNELDAVACRGTSLCVAVDTLGNVISFDPRAQRGAQLRSIDAGHALTTVACPTRTRCVLGDSSGQIWSGSPRGARWSPTRLQGASALTSVACVTGRECVAVDTAGDLFTAR